MLFLISSPNWPRDFLFEDHFINYAEVFVQEQINIIKATTGEWQMFQMRDDIFGVWPVISSGTNNVVFDMGVYETM